MLPATMPSATMVRTTCVVGADLRPVRREPVLVASGKRRHLDRQRIRLVLEEHVDIPVFDTPETHRGSHVIDAGHVRSLLASVLASITVRGAATETVLRQSPTTSTCPPCHRPPTSVTSRPPAWSARGCRGGSALRDWRHYHSHEHRGPTGPSRAYRPSESTAASDACATRPRSRNRSVGRQWVHCRRAHLEWGRRWWPPTRRAPRLPWARWRVALRPGGDRVVSVARLG